MVFIPPAPSLLLRFGGDHVPLLRHGLPVGGLLCGRRAHRPGEALSLALGPGEEMALLVSGTLPAPAALP